MPSLRGAGGGLSLGRALGASDDVAGECGSETGAGVELAGDGAPVWAELEERGDYRQAGGAIRLEEPGAAGGACDWLQSGSPNKINLHRHSPFTERTHRSANGC